VKNKCSVWKRIKFPTFWYNCYYFTRSDTYFIQLETLLINHPSYHVANYKASHLRSQHKYLPFWEPRISQITSFLFLVWDIPNSIFQEWDYEWATAVTGRMNCAHHWEELSIGCMTNGTIRFKYLKH